MRNNSFKMLYEYPIWHQEHGTFKIDGKILYVYTVVFKGNISTAYREEHLVAI